jgi:hypothetical protein
MFPLICINAEMLTFRGFFFLFSLWWTVFAMPKWLDAHFHQFSRLPPLTLLVIQSSSICRVPKNERIVW